MSKSLARVTRALTDAALAHELREVGEARTALDAAIALGCELDQIVKSIIFCGQTSQKALLFLTAGGNQVDPALAAAAAGETLGKADAALIRAQTGFAIGGVSPVGHLAPIRAFLDPRLLDFPLIWAAAGTPRHVFSLDSADLASVTGAQVTVFTQ